MPGHHGTSTVGLLGNMGRDGFVWDHKVSLLGGYSYFRGGMTPSVPYLSDRQASKGSLSSGQLQSSYANAVGIWLEGIAREVLGQYFWSQPADVVHCACEMAMQSLNSERTGSEMQYSVE